MSTARATTYFILAMLLLGSVLPRVAGAGPLILGEPSASASLAGHLDVLEDGAGTLTINEVSSPGRARLFRAERFAVPRAGFTMNVYWVRFTLSRDAAVQELRLLELELPYTSYLDLYLPRPGGGFDQQQAGSSRPMSMRKFQHRNPVFPLVVAAQPATFYLRVDGPRRAVLPLTLWSPDGFARMDARRALLAGCFFGAMLVMVVYNFFIFLSLRDRSYLYYILEILCFALFEFYSKGFLLEYVTPEMLWINKYTFLLGVPTAFVGLVFCRNFLATVRNAPRIDRLIKLNMFALLLCPALFVLSRGATVRTLVLLTAAATVLGLSAGIACLRKGFHPARYYIAARGFRMLGVFYFVLAMNNMVPWNLLAKFGLQAGCICEVLLLSFALADRINIMRREKESAQAEAIRSSHLASLGELAAGVAHEINTPVNTIINLADLLLEDEDGKSREHDVEVIKKEGRRIATIAGSLLFFSRQPEKEKVPFALVELLQGTMDMVGARLRKEYISLRLQVPAELKDVTVRPQQIEQVFLNILNNAIHALNERHGAAREKKVFSISACEVSVHGRPYVRVIFQDNGIGIRASLLDSVQQSFVTTKKHGTGLGLSICRQIVNDHGGTIGIESREHEFTRVSVDLPAAASV